MARVKGIIQVTGSLKGVSIYTMRGSDEVIMRTKGGPSKNTIKTRESCKPLRDNGREWGGCTKAASGIRRALGEMTRLADYNLSGALNAVCKKIQSTDVEGEKGQRPILVHANRKYLTDFQFNKKYPFNQVIRVQPAWEIDRQQQSAVVHIPDFDPEQHLTQPNKLPLMRWVINLGITTDVRMDEPGKTYFVENEVLLGFHREVHTAWTPVKRPQAAQTLQTSIEDIAEYLTGNETFVLSIGLEFGTIGMDGEGEAVKYSGCGKILAAE